MADNDAGMYFRGCWRVWPSGGRLRADALSPRRQMLPLSGVKRTYSDRLAVGDAAGMVKPTTGGGIYYSVVGEIAAG
jgi:flavin-dependent dehydrogenase